MGVGVCVCGKGIKSHLKFQNYKESSLQVRKRDKVFDWWVGGFLESVKQRKMGFISLCVCLCALEVVVSDKDRYRDRQLENQEFEWNFGFIQNINTAAITSGN